MSDIAPKKSLGQHWLHDAEVLESMCDSAGVQEGSLVLEIGPGLGTLTERLLSRNARVMALEFDHLLAETLTETLHQAHPELDLSNLIVREGDIRTFNFTELESGYKVCANIPYYLTSNLIRLMCDTPNRPAQAALLMQKEVAERIVADDGKMSMLSCVAHFYFECNLGDFVPARLFTPPPKVDSQILIMVLRQKPLFDVDQKSFFRLLRAGFSEKRKTLRNSLSGGLSATKEQVEALLAGSSIDPMRRAETLSLHEWMLIYDNLDALSK